MHLDRGKILDYAINTISGKHKRFETRSTNMGVWHADHVLPLWNLTEDMRGNIEFWLLGNLETRCLECHEEKSVIETKARAKMKRLEGKRIGTAKAKPKRAMQSRGFDKKFRKKMSGEVVPA